MRKTATQLLSTGVMDEYEVQAWIAEADIKDLEDFIRIAANHGVPSTIIRDAKTALQILLTKESLKPHWSVVPAFWVGFISAAATILGIWIAWITFRHDSQELKPAIQGHESETVNNALSSKGATNLPVTKPPAK
jgi:hypothetical protein